ncbi:MAG: sulfotransferase [Calothrix sp. MO_167.B12]|nr:sulfotransferase [Calothrix sp. MO_167.B12]
MKLPGFLIIGAAKSGTTSLYQYLKKHPQVYFPPKDANPLLGSKEPNFFGDDNKYALGIQAYASLFNNAQSYQICGEASTDYTKLSEFPRAAERIAKTLPHVKLIYIMRHPVERAYSYYVHLQRNQKVEETFEQHIQRANICLDGSNYMMQIEQYLKFFPRESLLLLLMEELIHNPALTLQNICQFLSIDDGIDLTLGNKIIANAGRSHFNDNIRGKITAPFRSIPVLNIAAKKIPQSWRDLAYSMIKEMPFAKNIQQQYLPQPMLPETRQLLLNKFKKSNEELADFMKYDLSHWSN